MNYYNYFSEIEELFIRRRGRNLLLSPLDWALIETWQERKVPLHIILSGIERIFEQADKQANKKRPIKSLLYCKEEIEARYAEWLEQQVGKANAETIEKPQTKSAPDQAKNELFSDDAIHAHLEKVSGEIVAAAAKAEGDFQATLEKISKQLAALRSAVGTAQQFEEHLEKLDAQIDASLRRNFETGKLETEVEKQIASYKTKMEPEVYQRTFDLMLLKRLREQKDVPRLSLFNL